MLSRNKLFENLLEVTDNLNSQKLEYLPDYKMECSVKLLTVLIKSWVTRLVQFSISRVVMLILQGINFNITCIVYLMGRSYWHWIYTGNKFIKPTNVHLNYITFLAVPDIYMMILPLELEESSSPNPSLCI